MDREERSAINSRAGNSSPHNSALRLATAFSKGTHSHSLVKNTLLILEDNFKYIYQHSMKKPGSYVTIHIIKLGLIGTVDIGHLPHPVLVHLRSFFDLWDSFVLQAAQSGQPYISDHLMFEVRALFHSTYSL